jgi:hypothetical protein
MDGVRNPQEGIGEWPRNFDTYAAAGLYHGWQHQSVRSYFYGNSFVGMARADPYPGTRQYYDKLYSVVKGTYPLMPDE